MKLKSILLTAVITLSLATATMAQVPNYVPTNGLVGWWPFNGNANDESGNGNNGTVNGATLSNDRNAIPNSAYTFDGNDWIEVNHSAIFDFQTNNVVSVSTWLSTSQITGAVFVQKQAGVGATQNGFNTGLLSINGNIAGISATLGGTMSLINTSTAGYNDSQWHHFVYIFNNQVATIYLDGTEIITQTNPGSAVGNSITNLIFGYGLPNNNYFFNGVLDDIGIWNRALTQQEITALYNSAICANNTAITPQTTSLTTGSSATFTATTSDLNPSYVWQSNFGQGFQTLNNFGNYNGTNTGTLNITNVQLPNHTQPIRVITTSGNCIDTSNIATINITDTCIVTINDTITTLISVTDTLIINATLTGLNPPNNLNTIKVFPNPANDHITINYGDFATMSGYTLKITNNLGQVVFTSPINQQSSYIDLSTWTGNGIYFVQIIDTQNNTIENRKIVIQ